jgi:hypothetical protein
MSSEMRWWLHWHGPLAVPTLLMLRLQGQL